MSIKKAVIPVAGHGTRLLPATKSQPKEMLPVGRKPVVQYVVEELEAAKLFTLFITAVLEPVGEQCRTVYDELTDRAPCVDRRRPRMRDPVKATRSC